MRIIDQGLDEQGNRISIEEVAEQYFWKINPKIKKPDRWGEDIFYKIGCLINRLEQAISSSTTYVHADFYKYLLDKPNKYRLLKSIITENAIQLEQIFIPQIESYLTSLGVDIRSDKKYREEIISILGYESIRSCHTQWLVDRLGIKTCPYCGIQYVLGVSRPGEKKVLCELDHFFPKDTYPYLCVSFYNLIPSCAFCNRLKSSSATSLSTHPHPYHHNFDQLFTFKTDPQEVIEVIIKGRKTISVQTDFNTSSAPTIDKHFDRFRLNEVYAHHSDIAEELYWKKYVYTDSRKDELVKLLGTSLGVTKGEIERFIVGNYVEDKDMLRRPLAKLMRDIAREVKLID